MLDSALSIDCLRVSPNATKEFPACNDGARGSCSDGAISCADESINAGWADLPVHLLETLFALLTIDRDLKAYYSVVGTCSSWRSVGVPMLFQDLWQNHKHVVHPSQLFSLNPHESLETPRPIMRCFVVRRPAPFPWMETSFDMWQGDSAAAASPRFLLSARQVSKSRYSIGLQRPSKASRGSSSSGAAAAAAPESRQDEHAAAAAAAGQTDSGPASPSGSAASGTSCSSADSTTRTATRTRVKAAECAVLVGNMQRTTFELWPGGCGRSYMLPASPCSSTRCSSNGSRSSDSGSSGSSTEVALFSSGGGGPADVGGGGTPLLRVDYCMKMLGLLMPRRLSVQVARPTLLRSNPLFDGASNPAAAAEPSDEDLSACSQQSSSLRLSNLLPHWNDELKCWSLNFFNRVKVPSIKNFQLVMSGREARHVLLQFGKVGDDKYVLDFNPAAMSSLQAFAVALSCFERKYAL